MTEIIPFPKTGERYLRELNEAVDKEDYNRAYDLLYEVERYVELSDSEQLLKLDILKQVGSFVELREEASILLNQGHPDYPTVVTYFLESLLALKQYQTVMELIDSLRTEAVDHQLLMQLAPLYDRAQKLRAYRDSDHQLMMTGFIHKTRDEQVMVMTSLLKARDYTYRSTVLLYIQHTTDALLQNMMLEYLMEAGCTDTIQLERNGLQRTINIGKLRPMDRCSFAKIIIPAVVDWFEQHTSMSSAAEEMMKQQLFLLYPFELGVHEALAAESYILYILACFNMDEEADFKETQAHLAVIEDINKLNQQ